MFLISNSIAWSFSYFFLYLYTFLTFSVILYLLPVVKEVLNYSSKKNSVVFDYLNGFDLFYFLITPLFFCLLISFSWSHYTSLPWFGHLIFSSLQYKINFLILFFFFNIIIIYTVSFYFSSREVYDYILTCFNFFFWIVFLFTANTIFTFIFFIEVLGTLIFLLVITSTFSTTYFYNNLNLNLHSYFNSTTPFFYVQMLMYFFWISLISSLNLFFFLVLFYIKFLTFDWFLLEFIFNYVVLLSNRSEVLSISLIWFNLVFCIFLKCGLVPFYFWKPIFFKGVPMHSLFFYISFFYFFLFLFIFHFFLVYVNEVFYFFIYINLVLILFGFILLLLVLCESYYLKTFLAFSSILNSLFVFFALSGLVFNDVIFFI